jgi:hypothetical protein
MRTIKVVIPPDGSPRAVYSEAAQALLAPLGNVEIRRASRVEPTAYLGYNARTWLFQHRGITTDEYSYDLWWADLTPVDGPVLGPYNTRDYALKEEIEWLDKNGTPFAS